MTGRHDNPDAGDRLRTGAFTLIEVMVVVMLLAFGLVAVLHSFQSAITAIGVAGERMKADLRTAEILADVERQAHFDIDEFSPGYRVHQDGELFWTTDIQLVGESAIQRSYRVDLTMWWTGGYRKYFAGTRVNTRVRN